MWNISNLGDNKFRLTQNDLYIEFKAIYEKEINLDSINMSRDSVIFVAQPYPTPEDEPEAIIGKALVYDKIGTCIDTRLVGVAILRSNVENPKACVEAFFA